MTTAAHSRGASGPLPGSDDLPAIAGPSRRHRNRDRGRRGQPRRSPRGETDQRESVATIHAAVDAGVTLLDTGDYYGAGHNEMLIRRALEGRRDRVLLSVKFGALRSADGGWIGMDARPVAVKNFLAYSLTASASITFDIYPPGRLDPAVPIEDTVGAIADLVKSGYVRYIGLRTSSR